MTHVVALSGGKDSTAMALRLSELEPREYVYLCTPTGNELPDMAEHWSTLESLLGRPLTRLTNGTLESWIYYFGALPNWRMRWCTRLLKIEPCIAFLKAHAPATLYVGLRADEPADERGGLYGPYAEYRYPLREWGWGLREVLAYNHARGVVVPRRTDCAWCYDQRLVEWRRLFRDHPDLYARGAALEQLTAATFRGPGRDTWPARLEELATEFASGRPIRGTLPLFDDAADPMRKCRVCSL